MLSAHDAIGKMIMESPGGYAAIAARLGLSYAQLHGRVNGTNGLQLSLTHAAQIADMCNSLGLATALAAPRGVVIPMPSIGKSEQGNTEDIADLAEREARFLAVVLRSVADGDVTDNELGAVDKAHTEAVAHAQQVRANVAAINAAGKPKGAANAKGRKA